MCDQQSPSKWGGYPVMGCFNGQLHGRCRLTSRLSHRDDHRTTARASLRHKTYTLLTLSVANSLLLNSNSVFGFHSSAQPPSTEMAITSADDVFLSNSPNAVSTCNERHWATCKKPSSSVASCPQHEIIVRKSPSVGSDTWWENRGQSSSYASSDACFLCPPCGPPMNAETMQMRNVRTRLQF